ncbi:MAG: sortase [Butyrivibrio sp.]|nr:sortase [Butyrivibrio sp.]
MRKKLVSILIANILFLSNVGFTSFAVEQNMDAAAEALNAETKEDSNDADGAEGTVDASSSENANNENSVQYFDEDEIEYVKIARFTELPEEVAYQKVGLGGSLEDINFPDTLEIYVVADNDREERISRNLGNERRERELAELEAAEAASLASSGEDDASAEGSSEEELEDEEKVVFFDSESDVAVDAATTDSESEDSQNSSDDQAISDAASTQSTIMTEEETTPRRADEEKSEKNETVVEEITADSGASNNTETNSEIRTESAPESNSESNTSNNTESSPENNSENNAEAIDAATDGNSENLIGLIKSAFKAMVVHAAENDAAITDQAENGSNAEDAVESKDEASKVESESKAENKSETTTEADAAADTSSEEPKSSEESAESTKTENSTEDIAEENTEERKGIDEYSEDEISIEMVSDIRWVLDAELNEKQEFYSTEVGKKYIFTPFLLIPDYYYIEAELPTITVEIVEEYYPFDKTVTVDDVKIRVRADKGVFPEGATLHATRVEEDAEQKVQDAITEKDEELTSVVKAYTFDIQIQDENGKEIEPDNEKGKVLVSFETAETGDEKLDAEIYHIIEPEGSGETKETDKAKDSEGEVKGESGAESASDNGENKTVSSGDEDFVIIGIEKLDSSVIEGEAGKAVEAETTSFSKYSLVISILGDPVALQVDTAYIDLDAEFAKKSPTYPKIEKVEFENSEAANYLNTGKYKTMTDSTGKEIPDISYYGLYQESNGNNDHWYLVVKRPFTDKSFVAKVTFVGGMVIKITITNDSRSGEKMLNNKYPTAEHGALNDNEFVLTMPVSDTGEVDTFFQWQKMANTAGAAWEDIALANTDKYGVSSGFVSGYWYRCLVDGKESNPVQVITPAGDTGRKWAYSCGSMKQCYVSNGTVAYTVVVDTATDKMKFEIVGQHKFENDSTVYMLQSSRGGNGWRVFSHTTTGSDITYQDYNNTLKYLWFSFDDDVKKIHVAAMPDIANDYRAVAIGADCNLGDAEEHVTYAATSSKTLQEIYVIGAANEETAQKAVNNGKGNYLPSLVFTPVTTPTTFYIQKQASTVAYPGTSSYLDTITGDSPSILSTWTSIQSGPIYFDFEFAGVESNGILTAVSKTGNSQNYNLNSVIKSLHLAGDGPLNSYAKKETLAGASVPVEVQLRFASATSTGKNAISAILPKYNKTTTSTSTTSSGSTSSTSTAYSADYFDINVKAITKTTKSGSTLTTTSTTTVDELDELVLVVADYNFEKKEDIRVFRYHGNTASEFSRSDSETDGTFQVDTNQGKIFIYTKKFSTYAIAYMPVNYYTVTFDTGSGTTTVNVKGGDKVDRPADPVKDGYAFKGWYVNGSSTNLYNFDNAVTGPLKLVAGWTEIKAEKEAADKAAAAADSEKDTRAPKTNDNMPIVWLWVLLLVAGVTTFGCSVKALMNDGKDVVKRDGFFTRLSNAIYRLEIVIAVIVKFILKKLQNNKQRVRIVVSSALIVISAIVITTTVLQYRKSENTYAEVEETYFEETPETITTVTNRDGSVQTPGEDEFNWWDCANVGLKELKEEYPDVVGWLYFENEDISYPIMYSGDNTKYLRTTYKGEEAKAGSIFVDGESSPDFSDPHSIVYGHNMRDLSMFGRLRYYATNPDYYKDHQYFQVFTENKVYRYQIFAYEEVSDNDDVFWVYGKEPEGYYNMLKAVEKNSFIDTGITTNESDHVITLATCTAKDDKRLIVSAVRVGEYQYNQ